MSHYRFFHFYADIEGNRGVGTRCGTKSSGIDGHIRGWNVGARISCIYDEESGKDICRIYKTGGSNGDGRSELIAEFCSESCQNKYAPI